jgi:hypothetical protein
MILAFVCNYKYILYENGASQQRFWRMLSVSPDSTRIIILHYLSIYTTTSSFLILMSSTILPK